MKTEPREALRYIRTCIEPNVDTAMSTITRYDAGIAAKIAFQEGQSNPKIKQLKWDGYGVYFDSISVVGHYIVFDGDKFPEASYRFALSYNGNLVDYFESLDEAMSAAQADFVKRVMECLDL